MRGIWTLSERSLFVFISNYPLCVRAVTPPKIVSSLVVMSYAFLAVLVVRCCGHSKASIDLCGLKLNVGNLGGRGDEGVKAGLQGRRKRTVKAETQQNAETAREARRDQGW